MSHDRVVEVGARDGLQNETALVAASTKIELIDRLSRCGLPVVEATSMVSPKWVPQLADAAEVLADLSRLEAVRYPVRVPNSTGLSQAIAAGAREIAVFTSASDAFNFHDTYGQALANVYACLEEGVRTVDASVGGVGGCPYAPGATGNVSTEDLLFMLEGLGVSTGVDLDRVIETARWISRELEREPMSRLARVRAA